MCAHLAFHQSLNGSNSLLYSSRIYTRQIQSMRKAYVKPLYKSFTFAGIFQSVYHIYEI